MKTSAPFLSLLLLFAGWAASPLQAGEAIRLYDFGADEIAYLSLPSEAPRAAILLVPDSLGIPEVVAARCDLLAKLGYVAMTVDFYNGQTAATLDRARGIQSRIRADSAIRTLSAALKLLTESPQYRSDRVIVAVWGPNMDFFRTLWMDPQKQKLPLAALSWLEPDGPVNADPFAGLPRPLQVLANNGPWLEDLEKAQAGQPLKRIPADIHPYNAKPGFLLQPKTEELGTQAWVSVIEFWKKTVELSPAAEPEPAPAAVSDAKESKAQAETRKKSSILPKR